MSARDIENERLLRKIGELWAESGNIDDTSQQDRDVQASKFSEALSAEAIERIVDRVITVNSPVAAAQELVTSGATSVGATAPASSKPRERSSTQGSAPIHARLRRALGVLSSAVACIALLATWQWVRRIDDVQAGPERRSGTPSAAGVLLDSPSNPFADADMYGDPAYVENVSASMAAHPQLASVLSRAKNQPTSFWLDSSSSISRLTSALVAARKHGGAAGRGLVPLVTVSTLPGRSCETDGSGEEFSATAEGAREYRAFIDNVSAVLMEHSSQPVALVLEPHVLAVLASRKPACAASQSTMEDSLAYAIRKLALANVSIYLDGGNAIWTGWDDLRQALVEAAARILTKVGPGNRVRGFATNVGAYTPLVGDGVSRLASNNPFRNEVDYITHLAEDLHRNGIEGMHFIVDTSRNGQLTVPGMGRDWCNLAEAGMGERPRVVLHPLIDAYVWVKPPGESDGTDVPGARRSEPNCGSSAALRGAPESGWFDAAFVGLVERANPPL